MSGNGQQLLEAARNSPREERLILLGELLPDFAARGGMSVIPTPGGRYVWAYFVPDADRTPPELSAEERAELRHRLDTIDDAEDIDEVIAEFRRQARDSGPGS